MIRHELEDGSAVEIEWVGYRTARYKITDAGGEVLDEGDELHPSPLTREEQEVLNDLVAFLRHDAEIHEFSSAGAWGKRYPDSAYDPDDKEYCFNQRTAGWAEAHDDELLNLATDA
jgi:hypothetical protein